MREDVEAGWWCCTSASTWSRVDAATLPSEVICWSEGRGTDAGDAVSEALDEPRLLTKPVDITILFFYLMIAHFV